MVGARPPLAVRPLLRRHRSSSSAARRVPLGAAPLRRCPCRRPRFCADFSESDPRRRRAVRRITTGPETGHLLPRVRRSVQYLPSWEILLSVMPGLPPTLKCRMRHFKYRTEQRDEPKLRLQTVRAGIKAGHLLPRFRHSDAGKSACQ